MGRRHEQRHRQFFDNLKADMTALARKQEQVQSMVADIYAAQAEQGLAPLDYPRFSSRNT
ncbi:MAG: hypothetical protein R3F38_19790 [Gammaproteobacteria bacterium]